MRKVDTMKKLLKKSVPHHGEATAMGLFVAPKKTLLDLFLSGAEAEVTTSSEEGIMFHTHRTVSNASTISPDMDEEEEDFQDDPNGEEGPSFRLGSLSKEEDIRDPQNPDSFPWCLINLCVTKLVQEGVRRILSTAGLEVLELVTASPLLYSTLKVLDEWESIFTRRLDALEADPEDLFMREDEDTGAMFMGVGPAIMRHKFILEPENSPFQGQTIVSKQARQLWEYLVHQDECREVFIHHIFAGKAGGSDGAEMGPNSRSLYKAVDSAVWSFCIHPGAQFNPTIMAVALPREVIEIEIPDIAGLDAVPYGDDMPDSVSMAPGNLPKRSQSVAFVGTGDFIMVQAKPYMRSPNSASSLSAPVKKYGGMHAQTGTSSSIVSHVTVTCLIVHCPPSKHVLSCECHVILPGSC
jgi:hypothetical protein